MLTVRLNESDRPALLAHFIALAAEDRRLRFGFSARDASIERYVKDLDFEHDAVFGVHGDGRSFDGITHLAFADHHAEIGVSVLDHARGRGIGSALVSRASGHARNRGIEVLYMQCLSENRTMIKIARTIGMRVITEGPDSSASMPLPAASPFSILHELVADQIALCDAALREVFHPRARPNTNTGETAPPHNGRAAT